MSLALIRSATAADAFRISALLTSFSHTYLVAPTADEKQAFLSTISEPAIRALIGRNDMDYMVAEDRTSGALAGAAGMQMGGVLIHLFVERAYQRKGLGRNLWEYLRDRAIQNGHSGIFTVYSSMNAVPVYEKFGFKVSGERIHKNGGAAVPMRFEFPSQCPGP